MKNVKAYVRTTLTAGLILAAAVLGGCSKSDAGSSAADTSAASADASNSNKKELKYGKAAGPYTVLFEDAIKPILEKEGYTLTEVDFSDLLQNDLALNDGEIDFNVEQHTAYAENFNEAQKGNLVPISPIPTVPAAIFSATETSLDAIQDGAKVAVPDDASPRLCTLTESRMDHLKPGCGSLHCHPGGYHEKPLQHRIYRNELHQYSSCFRRF